MTVGSTVVPPGKSTLVELRLVAAQAGPIAVCAGVETNDPRTPLLFFTLQGARPEGVHVTPESVSMVGEKGEELSTRVVLTAPPETELRDVACLGGAFQVRLEGPEPAGPENRWVIVVSASARAAGAIADELQIRTSHPARPLVSVPLSATVVGDLVARPTTLFWGLVRPDQPLSKTVTVRSRSGTRFGVLEVASSDSSVLVSAARRAGPSAWEAKVTLRPAAAGKIDTRIAFRTDVPGEEAVYVRCYAEVATAP